MKAIVAVLLTLRANAEIERAGGAIMPIGRTAMQELTYFASLRADVCATYYGHYHGPFSADVAEGIARLWKFGYLREDPPASDFPTYAYSLTRDGDRLGGKAIGCAGEGEYAAIAAVVGACRDYCGLRQVRMARAAKVRFMRDYNARPRAGAGEIVEMGRAAGWRMSEGEARDGMGLLGRLGAAPCGQDT